MKKLLICVIIHQGKFNENNKNRICIGNTHDYYAWESIPYNNMLKCIQPPTSLTTKLKPKPLALTQSVALPQLCSASTVTVIQVWGQRTQNKIHFHFRLLFW